MTSNTLVSDFSNITHDAQLVKETDSLPLPSTTPASQVAGNHGGVSQKLVWFLQYFNPLFYARLAQALVGSVLESYKSSPRIEFKGQIAEHPHEQIPIPAPADATAIECGYSANTHNSQFEVLPELDIEASIPSALPDNIDAVSANPEIQHKDVQYQDHQADSEESAEGGANLLFEPNEHEANIATTAAEKDIGMPERKNGKKGKRGKGKNKQ